MKNYEYVLDVRTPFIKKLYDKENNYKVELLTPYETLEELKKIQEENTDLETKLAQAKMNESFEKDKKDNAFKLIEELKQQLAEKEKLINNYADDLEKVANENADLVFKLAEKNKEIENIKLCRCVNCTNEYEFMLEGLVKDLEKQIDKDDQDKILFAVEQLEKVKEEVKHYGYEFSKSMHEYIDNQIKAIKEMK